MQLARSFPRCQDRWSVVFAAAQFREHYFIFLHFQGLADKNWARAKTKISWHPLYCFSHAPSCSKTFFDCLATIPCIRLVFVCPLHAIQSVLWGRYARRQQRSRCLTKFYHCFAGGCTKNSPVSAATASST